MDQDDPISTFFPGEDDVNLYAVLNLDSAATIDDIKKSYRRLALTYHPDKHSSSSEEARASASEKFQQIGFAYSVLSDEKRRSKYDRTGRTDNALEIDAGEGGWEAYFSELFDRVTKGKLDELKKEYQGSLEEIDDLKRAYVETGGHIEDIMNHIPHSTYDDEPRFITTLSRLIKDGDLPKLQTWEMGIKDEKAKLVRKNQGEKEAAEAEATAKELGVWEEFYGSGKPGRRKGKGKSEASLDDNEDYSALQALILSKRNKADGFLNKLAEKYAEPKPKGKKRGVGESSGPSKRSKVEGPPDIDEVEFQSLQQKLFKDEPRSDIKPAGRAGRAQKGRR